LLITYLNTHIFQQKGNFIHNNMKKVSLEFAEVEIESQKRKCQSDTKESQAGDAEKGCRLNSDHS
jgi:hypothetical protein